jgi:Flp pilus assembly protein TadG
VPLSGAKGIFIKMIKKIFSNKRGSTAVEMALILPVLVMMLFGIFQFGIAFNNWIALTHAAREGARLAAVGNFDEQAVRDSAPSVTIQNIDISGEGGDIGDTVTVTVTGSVLNIEIPFIGSWPVQLHSTASMRLEYSG